MECHSHMFVRSKLTRCPDILFCSLRSRALPDRFSSKVDLKIPRTTAFLRTPRKLWITILGLPEVNFRDEEKSTIGRTPGQVRHIRDDIFVKGYTRALTTGNCTWWLNMVWTPIKFSNAVFPQTTRHADFPNGESPS